MPGVVIVGASAAALSVAETLRRDSFDGRITLIGEEARLPYDRPPLSKEVLAGTWSEDMIALRDTEKISALGLDRHRSAAATVARDRRRRRSARVAHPGRCPATAFGTGWT
jgi:NADPH-dependent 2,4-dienoyl-CoA reductase/sulfur reductase-like enzyme